MWSRQNNKYVALERFARRNDLTLLIPERVYEGLGGAPTRSTPGQTPIDSAIESGWVAVADPPDYTNGTVASVMDDVRRRIAHYWNARYVQLPVLVFIDTNRDIDECWPCGTRYWRSVRTAIRIRTKLSTGLVTQ